MSEEREVRALSSIELTRNAKGATQIVVKVYEMDPGTAEDAHIEARRIYDALCARYPMPEAAS